jgi:hypothetical protein
LPDVLLRQLHLDAVAHVAGDRSLRVANLIDEIERDRNGIQNVAIYNNPIGGSSPIIAESDASMISVCLPGDRECGDPRTGADSRVTVTISGYPMVIVNLFLPRSFTNRSITASLPSEAPTS